MEKTGLGFSRIEIFSIFFCCLIALSSFLYVRKDIFAADERGYLHAAADIADEGVDAKWAYSDGRTYGYPLYFSEILRFFSFRERSNVLIRWPLFASQLLMYIGTAFFIRRKIIKLTRHVKFARYFFVCWNMNIFALIYLSFSLTDLLSLIFIYLSFFLLLNWLMNRGFLKAFLAGASIGFSMMIRPANVLLLPLAGLIILGAFVYYSDYKKTFLNIGMFLFGIGLLCAPQWLNNYVYYERITPLVAYDLGHSQLNWGMQDLKYATSHFPGKKPEPVSYKSPWFPEEIEGSAWRIYFENPFQTLKQFLVKIFALIDMDLCFPYNKTLRPWYRWPGSIVSISIAIFGVFGLFLSKNYFKKSGNLSFSIVYAVIAAGGIIFTLGYSFTAIECRFGLPVLASLLAMQFPFWESFTEWTNTRKLGVLAAAIFLLSAGLFLSDWLQAQSPEIQSYVTG